MPRQVVILHGWSDDSESFEPLAKFLKQNGYKTVPLFLGDYISLRDEVKIDSRAPVYFSTEEVAHAETFKAGEAGDDGQTEIYCPRCRKAIENEAAVVRCPVCSLLYHFSEDDDSDGGLGKVFYA